MVSAKDFFSTIDLSKLDIASATQIREEILTLSPEDWDLIDNDSEMQKQMEIIKDRIEKEFPTALGLKSNEEKTSENIQKINEANLEKSKLKASEIEKQKEALRKEQEDFEAEKAKYANDIEEMQMLIELTQDTLKDNPNDEDLPLYLELLNDTLQGILTGQKDLLSKKNTNKTAFANGGELVINDTDIASDNEISSLLLKIEKDWGKDSDYYSTIEGIIVGYYKSDSDGDMYLNANGIKRINEELANFDFKYRLTSNGIVDIEELEEDTNNLYVYKFHEERGEVKASVEDMTTGITVWEYNYPDYSLDEDEREFQSSIVEDGFMKNFDDVEGLENYLKSLQILPMDAELISEEDAIQDYQYYANGGSIFSNSNHNTGRSWHLDRQRYNSNEDWEKPLRKRKRKYKNGGLADDKTHEYRVMFSYKSKDGVFTEPFQDKDKAKAFYDEKIKEDDIELVMFDYNQYNKLGYVIDHKHFAAYSWRDTKFENGGGVNDENEIEAKAIEYLTAKPVEKHHHEVNYIVYQRPKNNNWYRIPIKEVYETIENHNEALKIQSRLPKSFENGGEIGINFQSNFDDEEFIKNDIMNHVSDMVKNGYTSGELVGEEPDYNGWWEIDIEEDENNEEIRNEEVAKNIRNGNTSGYSPNYRFNAKVWSNNKMEDGGSVEESLEMKSKGIVLLEGEQTIDGQIKARQDALNSTLKEIANVNSDVNPDMLQAWKLEHEKTLSKLNELKHQASPLFQKGDEVILFSDKNNPNADVFIIDDYIKFDLGVKQHYYKLKNKNTGSFYERYESAIVPLRQPKRELSPEQKRQLESIYEKYHDLDYWGYGDSLKSQLNSWRNAYAKGDKGALKYTEQDIIDNMWKHERMDFDRIVSSVREMIYNKDVTMMISRLRYDQKVSLEIYEVLTGEKIKGMSNKELSQYFTSKYGS